MRGRYKCILLDWVFVICLGTADFLHLVAMLWISCVFQAGHTQCCGGCLRRAYLGSCLLNTTRTHTQLSSRIPTRHVMIDCITESWWHGTNHRGGGFHMHPEAVTRILHELSPHTVVLGRTTCRGSCACIYVAMTPPFIYIIGNNRWCSFRKQCAVAL